MFSQKWVKGTYLPFCACAQIWFFDRGLTIQRCENWYRAFTNPFASSRLVAPGSPRMGFTLMAMTRVGCLRTFALIVSAHSYCAYKFTCQVMHRALAFGQMTISSPEPSLPLSSGTGKRSTLGKSILNNRILVIPVKLSRREVLIQDGFRLLG